jgi:hypothetical protein
MSKPPYVVFVEEADDFEHLRDLAYGAANGGNYGTTEHWDDPAPFRGRAFCFMAPGAAVSFMAQCALAGIPRKGG